MKVALICPTIGQTRRGYERYFSELFNLVKEDIDITLFKGGGDSTLREKVIPHVKRTGLLSRIFRERARYPRYQLEFASFAASLFPHLLRGQFDLVHFVDPPLGRWLHASRRLVRKPFGLLFSNAGPISYDSSRWVDHIHCLSPGAVDEARALGLPSERLSMLPIGVDCERLVTASERDELRRRLNIPLDAFVILSVTTLNRKHKRVDYLIEEASRLDGNFLLWIDGSLHPDGDPTLLDLAAAKLGNRHRHTHVASDRVIELFKMADVMVSTALQESFGMAIVESMCSGLPVVAHDSPHFRWLVANSGHVVDMSKTGSLTSCLQHFLHHPQELKRPGIENVCGRFGWPALKARYLAMYGKAARSDTR